MGFFDQLKDKASQAGEKAGAALKDASRPAAPADDPLEQLKKLNALKEAGILSDEEFNAKKAELLSKV